MDEMVSYTWEITARNREAFDQIRLDLELHYGHWEIENAPGPATDSSEPVTFLLRKQLYPWERELFSRSTEAWEAVGWLLGAKMTAYDDHRPIPFPKKKEDSD